jgi:hypothetical protein
MPAGLIEKENGVGAGVDGKTDFFQMLGHGGGIAPWHDQAGALALGGTNCAKNISRCRTLILGGEGPRASFRLAPRDLIFLADARLVLPPQLYRGAGLELRLDPRQFVRETFLKSAIAVSLWA